MTGAVRSAKMDSIRRDHGLLARVLGAGAALLTFFAWGFLTEGWLILKDFASLLNGEGIRRLELRLWSKDRA